MFLDWFLGHKKVQEGDGSRVCALKEPKQSRRGVQMQEAKTYRQYAADCRRIAETMSRKDGEILLKMAEAWDSRAEEAERVQSKKSDGRDEQRGGSP
jgi:hypothetical protein